MVSSVLNIIPSVQRIFLSTRPSNHGALKAYDVWGFALDENPIQEPHYKLDKKQWVSLEYEVDQSDLLQKTARTLLDK